MDVMLFGFWLVWCGVVAWSAQGRGRSGLGWFLLALVVSPLLIHVLLVLVDGWTPRKTAVAAKAGKSLAIAVAITGSVVFAVALAAAAYQATQDRKLGDLRAVALAFYETRTAAAAKWEIMKGVRVSCERFYQDPSWPRYLHEDRNGEDSPQMEAYCSEARKQGRW